MTDQHVPLVAPIFERSRVEGQDLQADNQDHDALFDQRAGEADLLRENQNLDDRYAAHNNNWVQDLVAVVQHGNVKNTFHWKPSAGVGMLESVERMLIERYGNKATAEHVDLLRRIAERGSPRHWALMWLFMLSIDAGLQQYVTSAEVRSYVGTDGRPKQPSDPDGLFCYLRALRAAMHSYAIDGMHDSDALLEAVTSWHVYGGQSRAHHSFALKHSN